MLDEEEQLLEEDSAGYLISVSDMMAGLLFVFILTLTAFIISFQAARDQAKSAVQDLTNGQGMRKKILTEIKTTLKEQYNVDVQVNLQHGILRLTEKAISFPLGKAILPKSETEKLRAIATVLNDVIPCYSANPSQTCNKKKQGELEAAFIEGHTDNMRVRASSRYEDNLELSTARAAFTFRELTEYQPELAELKNANGHPIFSVSGYGAGRPINPHSQPTNDPANRRIDLRFIMAPPSVEAKQVIQDLHTGGVK